MERTGWWFKVNRNVLVSEPPPRLRRFVCFALFLYWRSHPSWPGGAMARSAKYVIAAEGNLDRNGFVEMVFS